MEWIAQRDGRDEQPRVWRCRTRLAQARSMEGPAADAIALNCWGIKRAHVLRPFSREQEGFLELHRDGLSG